MPETGGGWQRHHSATAGSSGFWALGSWQGLVARSELTLAGNRRSSGLRPPPGAHGTPTAAAPCASGDTVPGLTSCPAFLWSFISRAPVAAGRASVCSTWLGGFSGLLLAAWWRTRGRELACVEPSGEGATVRLPGRAILFLPSAQQSREWLIFPLNTAATLSGLPASGPTLPHRNRTRTLPPTLPQPQRSPSPR